MIKQSVKKIYKCVIRLIHTIEDNIDECDSNDIHETIKTNKYITETLLKLVTLINNLKQLSELEQDNQTITMPEEDIAIIQAFLTKHHTKIDHATQSCPPKRNS